jgi:DNA-directed RNA polymerase specialized sigma24 family protein
MRHVFEQAVEKQRRVELILRSGARIEGEALGCDAKVWRLRAAGKRFHVHEDEVAVLVEGVESTEQLHRAAIEAALSQLPEDQRAAVLSIRMLESAGGRLRLVDGVLEVGYHEGQPPADPRELAGLLAMIL